MDTAQLGAALVTAFEVMQSVNAPVKPPRARFGLDPFWMLHVPLGLGAPLAWFPGMNALPVFGEAPVIGRC